VKQINLSIAAAVFVIAGGTAAFAAELPSYQTAGLPISPVQARALGADNISEQSPVAVSTVTPLQRSVLTPRTKVTAATRTVGSVR
jgi:hypothetical protein